MLSAMSVPLTLIGARLHWRWVLAAILCAAVYYYIMYRLDRGKPLAEQMLTAYGKGGKPILWLIVLWLLWLTGWLADRSTLVFPQSQTKLLTGLPMLLLAAWAAKQGIRTVLRCGAVLLPLICLLTGTVLLGSAPKIRAAWLTPAGDFRQALLFLPILTLPTVSLFLPAKREGKDRKVWWLLAGGALALAASLVTAGCLSPKIAEQTMSFYALASSVSLLGTVERFEALISGACLAGYFCLCALLLCSVRRLLAVLLSEQTAKKLWLFPPAALAAVLSSGLPVWIFCVGAAIFCGIFPLITQGIVALKKDEKNSEKTGKSC